MTTSNSGEIQQEPISKPSPKAMSASSPPGKEPPQLRVSLSLNQIPWEAVLYVVLMSVALLMRLWNLDARAVHYDESIHSYDSWKLFMGNGYTHSPWAHGPVQYMMGATSFFLFGDTLSAPRVIPALFGSALVLMPLLLRSQLGKWGAFCAALFIAFSPSLLYFSRFLREDTFVLVWDFGLIVCLWRYIDSKKNRYLYISAFLLCLSFATKETAFISLATVASFLAVWWLRTWRSKRQEAPVIGGYLILIAALTLPLASAAFGALVDKLPGNLFDFQLVNNNNASGAGRIGSPTGGSGAYAAAGIIVFIMFIASLVVGWKWRQKIYLIALLAFWVPFFLLHTTFLTNMVGLGTGVWQSLGYWIAQQSVARGNQPWYYYFMTLSLYESVIFFTGIVAVLYYVAKQGRDVMLKAAAILVVSVVLAIILSLVGDDKLVFAPLALGLAAFAFVALEKGDPFEWFLVYWTLITVILYIVAGEKMPWLTTHMALPLAILAGKAVGELLESTPWRELAKRGGPILLVSAPLLLLAIYAMAKSAPWDNLDLGAWAIIGAIFFTVVMLIGGSYIWKNVGSKTGLKLVSLSFVGLLLLLTVRTSVQTAYVNDDIPKELIIYSQAGEGVPLVIKEIDAYARKIGKGYNTSIIADTDDAALAPWRWYLRDYKGVKYVDMSTYKGELTADVILLSKNNQKTLTSSPRKANYTEGEDVNILVWFPPWLYQKYSFAKFREDFYSAKDWNHLLRYYFYRDLKSPPATNTAYAYFQKVAP